MQNLLTTRLQEEQLEYHPSRVVYGTDPLGPLYIVSRPLDQRRRADAEQRVEEIRKLYERTRDRIKKINSTYSA